MPHLNCDGLMRKWVELDGDQRGLVRGVLTGLALTYP